MKRSRSDSKPGLREGFRSGLEDTIAKQLRGQGIDPQYETLKLKYTKPEKQSVYTPDFQLLNGIIVETKGRFVLADRQKHILIKQQHPNLDIRFVFYNSKARITKKSNTTYACWCRKHGFLFADKVIPQEWIDE